MTVSETAQAVLLLTAYFSKTDSGLTKPLAPKEYGRFAEWLHQRSLTPAHLLRGNPTELLDDWRDKTVSLERVNALLERGSALAISMERWLRSGLWVMTRSDPDYPRRLKQRLGGDSPAVLFGCGNRALLNNGGLAVVGSRNVKDADLAYSSRLGALASNAEVTVVSGGARGVDETAMLGALSAEGAAVGVLSDSLLRACSAAKYRKYLLKNSLVLVSPFNPEAGFNAGNAMQRNKYIYCLADAVLAVHSGKTGGTWSGAQEDLRKGWVPLWVKPTDDPDAGNTELIAAGALEAPASIEAVEIAAFFRKESQQANVTLESFDQRVSSVLAPLPLKNPGASIDSERETPAASHPTPELADPAKVSMHYRLVGHGVADTGSRHESDLLQVSLYELFIVKAKALCQQDPRTTDELAAALAINKTQLNAWLKQAVDDGELAKLAKPIRYEAVSSKQRALALD
jgi:predicted Rossmann fold nucleotide-binding protein DprA/Smf involved in DNA uptake